MVELLFFLFLTISPAVGSPILSPVRLHRALYSPTAPSPSFLSNSGPPSSFAAATAATTAATAAETAASIGKKSLMSADLTKDGPTLRPCVVTVGGGQCGLQRSSFSKGPFCPPDYPICALEFGYPWRYKCKKFSLIGALRRFSSGKCSCRTHGSSCAENSRCTDTLKGPQCKCNSGYKEQDGHCVVDPFSNAVVGSHKNPASAAVAPAGQGGDGTTATDNEIHVRKLPSYLRPCLTAGEDEKCGFLSDPLEGYVAVYCRKSLCCYGSAETKFIKKCVKKCPKNYIDYYAPDKCTCAQRGEWCSTWVLKGMSCVDTSEGPYCACQKGEIFNQKTKECIAEPQQTPTKTRQTPTVTAATGSNGNTKDAAQCGPEDCRPGFCYDQTGKVKCECVEGYTAKNVNSNRQQCVFARK